MYKQHKDSMFFTFFLVASFLWLKANITDTNTDVNTDENDYWL